MSLAPLLAIALGDLRWALIGLLTLLLPLGWQSYNDYVTARRMSESGTLQLMLGSRLSSAQVALGFVLASLVRTLPILVLAGLALSVARAAALPGFAEFAWLWVSVLGVYTLYSPNLVLAGVAARTEEKAEILFLSTGPIILTGMIMWPLAPGPLGLLLTGMAIWLTAPMAFSLAMDQLARP